VLRLRADQTSRRQPRVIPAGHDLLKSVADRIDYRPEIDGLRALAVLAVVIYHGGLGLTGGYVGVDVFFVISGYLITALIIRDLQTGNFTLKGFWERRVRRIVPALAAVVLATLVAGWFILLPQDYAALGKSAAYQAVFTANFHFWQVTENGYFAPGPPQEMPLLHTWSLAVEEQFYMIVPLLLVLLFKFPGLRTRRMLLFVLSAGFAASLLASQNGVLQYKHSTFFLLPTRAWELLAGSLVAILPACGTKPRGIVREVLSYLGLAGIVLPCVYYSHSTWFPGFTALPPCLGCALIIWSNSRAASSGARPTTSLGTLLSMKAVVFAGLVSYSLYLWHWPVLAFAQYSAAGEGMSTGYRICLLAASFGLAVLSWRFIETPFRRRTCPASRPAIFKMAFASTAVLCACGVLIDINNGFPRRLPEELQHALARNPKDDYLFVAEMETADIRTGKFTALGQRSTEVPAGVLIWGDSHAMAAMPAFDLVLKKHGIRGQGATHSGRPPVIDYWTPGSRRQVDREFSSEVVSYVERNRIPHAVMISSWGQYLLQPEAGRPDVAQPLPEAILATVRKLKSSNCQPWIMLQVPQHPHNPVVLSRNRRTTLPDLNDGRICARPDLWNGITDNDRSFLQKLEQAGARIIDPRAAFLDERGELYQIVRNGIMLYRDASHLTKGGAEMVLMPVLEQTFEPHLARSFALSGEVSPGE
jgi:peptidoglycan/LPS O-acetylase OafA/YrhL